MKQIQDASENVALNGVTRQDGTTVAWAVAFPRDYDVILGTVEDEQVAA